LLLTAVALAAPPTGQVVGEVDAKGLTEAVAREKGKVVLVNFWATWCVPCREEFPDLSRLQKNLGPKGFALIGVSTDFAKEAPAVRKFLAEQKPLFANYHKKTGGDDQVFIEAVDKEWGGELPFSVLYDRAGRKSKTFSGKHSYEEYEKEILRLAGK